LLEGSREIAELFFARVGRNPDSGYSIVAEDASREDIGISYHYYSSPMRHSVVLAHAAHCGSIWIVGEMLRAGKCDVNAVMCLDDERPFTALSRVSDPEILRMFLHAYVDLNPQGCQHVLRGSFTKRQRDCVVTLLNAGAIVSLRGAVESLLFSFVYEATMGRTDYSNTLVDILFDAEDSLGDDTDGILFVLDSVEFWSLVDMPSFLARDPSLLRWKDCNGLTALATVVMQPQKRTHLAKALLEMGADPGCRDVRGTPVLFYLLYTDDSSDEEDVAHMCKIFHMLLAAGADPAACPDSGETLLMQVLSLAKCRYTDSSGIPTVPSAYSDAVANAMLTATLTAVAASLGVAAGQQREQGQVEEEEETGDDCVPPQKRARRYR
jgi:hypothetical protein